MNHLEYLLLLQKLQQEKLLREMQRERLVKAILREQPDRRGLIITIIDWIRARLSEKDGKAENSCGRHRSPQPSSSLESSR